MVDTTGTIQTGEDDVLEVFACFYEELFASGGTSTPNIDALHMVPRVTVEEVGKQIKEM